MKRSGEYRNLIKLFLIEFAIFIILFIVLYIVFANIDIIPAGDNLHRTDWLAFVGTYLSLMGTVFLSTVTVWQGQYYNKKEVEHRQDEYDRAIMPHLSVSIVATNSYVDGMDVPQDGVGAIIQSLRLQNVTFEIRNVGQYATTNIYINDQYISASLMPGETVMINTAKPSAVELEKYPKLFIELDAKYNEDGLPISVLLQSNDIEGRLVAHEYHLVTSERKEHYSYDKNSPAYSVYDD